MKKRLVVRAVVRVVLFWAAILPLIWFESRLVPSVEATTKAPPAPEIAVEALGTAKLEVSKDNLVWTIRVVGRNDQIRINSPLGTAGLVINDGRALRLTAEVDSQTRLAFASVGINLPEFRAKALIYWNGGQWEVASVNDRGIDFRIWCLYQADQKEIDRALQAALVGSEKLKEVFLSRQKELPLRLL